MNRIQRLRVLCDKRNAIIQRIADELEVSSPVCKDSDVSVNLDLSADGGEENMGQPDGVTLIREDQKFFLTQEELEGLINKLEDWGLI